MDRIIDITGSIIIKKELKQVFEYVSNYRNDKFWRKPINETAINTNQIEKGSLITEDIFLSSKIPHFFSNYICIEYQPYKSVIIETVIKDEFWSKNTRLVEAINDSSSKITYCYQVDIGIVKHGLGFSLPTFLVNLYTNMEMKMYLKALKRILEE